MRDLQADDFKMNKRVKVKPSSDGYQYSAVIHTWTNDDDRFPYTQKNQTCKFFLRNKIDLERNRHNLSEFHHTQVGEVVYSTDG